VNPLEIALEYFARGIFVLPAQFKGKTPTVPWKEYQNGFTVDQIPKLFDPKKRYNYWILCGSISHLVVVDCDNEKADQYWHNKLGELLDNTTTEKTAQVWHY
jgi:hypothetical protein